MSEVAAWQSEQRLGSDYQPKPTKLNAPHLVMLRNDLTAASILIATSGSIANAIGAFAFPNLSLYDVATYMPRPSSLLIDAPKRMLGRQDDDDAFDIAKAIQEFLHRLDIATRLAHSAARKSTKATAKPTVDIAIVLDATIRACQAAREANTILAGIMNRRGERHSFPQSRVIPILDLTEHGGWPCIDSFGQVTMPGWAERRHEKRFAVNQSATIDCGDGPAPIMVADASSSGLGLIGNPAKGCRVNVTLADGRKLSGSIVWTENGRAGMALDHRLSRHDPLMKTPA